MNIKIDKAFCYLCGEKINNDFISDDHVPPKQFYAKIIRKNHSPNLFTLPTHETCNKAYQSDEDYFVHSLAPLVKGTYSGNSLLLDVYKQFKRPEGRIIKKMILEEFDKSPSGLILPNGKIIKRFNGKRICRIVWKITRGLFYKEKNEFLPEETLRYFKIVTIDDEPPVEFQYIAHQNCRGDYPEVFDYKYLEVDDPVKINILGMLLWGKIVIVTVFHCPKCECDRCEMVKKDPYS